jgi:hypothetical protein
MRIFLTLFALAMACTLATAQAPPNDNACQATQLTVGTVCNYQTFTTENATASTGSAVPNCANFVSGATADIWFKATVPASGSLFIDTQEGTVTNGGMAVYRSVANNCVALVLLSCDDNSSANGDMPALTMTGLTPGSTIFIRFWENGSDTSGTLGICVNSISGPANDDPCNAIQLTVGTNCNYQTFTTENASTTTGVPAPVCAGYFGGDVWFKVTVPASGGLLFDSQAGDITDGGMAAYISTDCASLTTLIACDDNSSANGDMPSMFISGQPPGSTLWVRFWENGNNNNGTFGICVTNVPNVSNDEPCNAIELTTGIVCNYQAFTNLYSSATTSVASPSCASYAGGDVWFKVVVPAGSGGLVFDGQAGDIIDGGMAVYSGTACGSLTVIDCDDNSSGMPSLRINNQPAGDTLWVRFWEYGNDNRGTFGICVKNLPAPANDDPCNAIELTLDSVCNFQTFTTLNATATQGVHIPDCSNYSGGDVWFKVIVPASGGVYINSQAGVVNDAGMAVYSGEPGCGDLLYNGCDDDAGINNLPMPALLIKNRQPGSTLWIRFWEYGNDNNGTFGICARSILPPPVNDEPCGAIELPVGTVCNYQTFTNENSTTSPGGQWPDCANFAGGDVWFKVIVPAGSNGLLFDTQSGVISDGGMALYSGTNCISLDYLGCDDDGSADGAMPAFTLTNQPAGSTIWVRIWEYDGNLSGTFSICVRNIIPLLNDEPCNAIELAMDTVCSYQTFTTENATVSTVQFSGCANAGADAWFKVTMPAGGSLFFDMEAGTITDGAMAVYKGNRCDSLRLIDCADGVSGSNDLMPTLVIENQAPGTTLWVRCWDNGGNNNGGTFSICVKKPSPSWADITYTKYPVDFGNVIQYTDTSTTSGGLPITSWHWDFGDGDTSNLQNPIRFTNYLGSATITLTVKNSNNEYRTKFGYMWLAIFIPSILKLNLCQSMDSSVISSPVFTGNARWQMSTDSVNFTNISDNINFSGTNTPVLTLQNIPASWGGRVFRCSSDEGYYSWKTAIQFANEFTNITGSNWENPANWSCGILPDVNTNVIINGNATLNSNASCRSLYVNPGATFTVSPGFTLTLTH